MNKNLNRGALTLPAAIIIAGALVAIALIWVNKPSAPANSGTKNSSKPEMNGGAISPITAQDHILGNPQAPIKLVEYSDPSCPYCKLFHPTIEAVMKTYGAGGKVAWVYRQFPLYLPDDQGRVIHPNSLAQAEALECASALGGNSVFFSFLHKWFEDFPVEGGSRSSSVDAKEVARVAKYVGLDTVPFNDCLSSHRFKDKIATSYQEALSSGITGTPYTVILTPSGNKIPLTGGQDLATLKNIINTLITTIPDEGASTLKN